MSYKAEINDGSGWGTTQRRFATRVEAEKHARERFYNWVAAIDWRVVESDDPVTEGLGNAAA